MKQTGESTRMREQATTDAAGAKPSLLGQWMLALPGIGELWLVWSELGLVMLSLPDRAPGEVEADMVDRCRRAQVDPEAALRATAARFRDRFQAAETAAAGPPTWGNGLQRGGLAGRHP